MNLKKRWKSFLRTSKGSIFDSLTAVLFALLLIPLVIIFLIIYQSTGTAIGEFNEAQAGSEISEVLNTSAEPLINNADAYPAFWDFLVVGLVFMVWIVALISAFILGNNSAFLIIYILVSISSIVLGVGVKTALVFLLEDSTINVWTQAMPMTIWLANNYIIVSTLFVIGIGIVLYIKRE